MSSDGTGYILPETIDPEATRCVLLAIPDDPYYWAAFWGQLEALGRWYTWERNDAKTGKDAAAVWQSTIEAARARWKAEECPIMLRVSPTNPCILEESDDGGETWTVAMDTSECSDQPDPGTPFPPGTDDAGIDAAANVANWYDAILCLIVDGIDASKTDNEIVADVAAYVNGYAPSAASAASIHQMIDAMNALTPAERADLCGGDVPQEIFDGIICDDIVSHDDGSILDWIADYISDWLVAQDNALVDALEAFARVIGLNDQNTVAGASGGGGGAGFTVPECDWEYTFDFAVSDGDWYPREDGWDNGAEGEWISEEGWHSVCVALSTDETKFNERLIIFRDIQDTIITSISLDIDGGAGNPGPPWQNAIFRIIYDGTPLEYATPSDPYEGGSRTMAWSGSETVDKFHIQIYVDHVSILSCPSGGEVTALSVTVEGEGQNPFI